MTSEEVVRKFFELFDAEDLGPFKQILHPQISWTMMGTSIPGFGTPHIGRDHVVDEVITPARGGFVGRPRSVLHHLFVSGDWVIAEIEGFGDFKNGQKYHNFYCIIFEVKDGVVTTLREYMDTGFIVKMLQG